MIQIHTTKLFLWNQIIGMIFTLENCGKGVFLVDSSCVITTQIDNKFNFIADGAEKQVTNAVDIKMKLNKISLAVLVDPCTKSVNDVKKFQLSALDFLSKLLSIKPSDNEQVKTKNHLTNYWFY